MDACVLAPMDFRLRLALAKLPSVFGSLEEGFAHTRESISLEATREGRELDFLRLETKNSESILEATNDDGRSMSIPTMAN